MVETKLKTPAYQIDFTATGTGRSLGMTKQRISFKFGFANAQAMANGCVGVECRGQEHEVTCIWSVTSGKRQVFVDGKEVHHSVSSNLKKKFIVTFPFLTNEHDMKLTAHAAPPISSTRNGLPQRQYDLSLDGQSYFEFARLFELGTKVKAVASPVRRQSSTYPANNTYSNISSTPYKNYSLDDADLRQASSADSPRGLSEYSDAPAFAMSKEEADLKAAIELSLQEERERKASEAASAPKDLLDFSFDEVHSVSPSFTAPTQHVPSFAAVYNAPVEQYSGPVGQEMHFAASMDRSYTANMDHSYGVPIQHVAPQVAPVSPMADAWNTPKLSPYQNFQYQQSSYEILNKYNTQAANVGTTEDCTDIVPVVKLSMAHVVEEKVLEEESDPVAKATKKLVNLDFMSAPKKPVETVSSEPLAVLKGQKQATQQPVMRPPPQYQAPQYQQYPQPIYGQPPSSQATRPGYANYAY